MTKKTFDALIIPTGETTFGEYSFPVTDEAIRQFNKGNYGCIFITGGYSGFATAERKKRISEARETYVYMVWERGINPEKVHYDDQSLESMGNFTFPIASPMPGNPNFKDFKNMQVIGQKGHLWRLQDYARVVMPGKFKYDSKEDEEDNIKFYSVPGEHNNGLAARVYHKGLMKAVYDHLLETTTSSASAAEKVHDFIIHKHPFHSTGWFDKSPLRRKAEMALVGVDWLMK